MRLRALQDFDDRVPLIPTIILARSVGLRSLNLGLVTTIGLCSIFAIIYALAPGAPSRTPLAGLHLLPDPHRSSQSVAARAIR